MKNKSLFFLIIIISSNIELFSNENNSTAQSLPTQSEAVSLKMTELDLILKNPNEEKVYLSNDIKESFSKFNKILSNTDIPQSQISEHLKHFSEIIKNEDSFTTLEIAYNAMLNSQVLIAKNKLSFDEKTFTEISNSFVSYLNDLKNKEAQLIHINDETNNDNALRKRKKVLCKLLVKDVLKVGKCLVVCGNEIVQGSIRIDGPAVFNNLTLFNRPVTINVPVSRVAGVDALTVIGTVDIDGSLIVRGTAFFGSDVNVTGNLNVAGQINSTGSNAPVTNAANVGSGQGQVFRDKTGTILNFKTLLAGTNVTITNNANDVTINAIGAGLGDVTGPAVSTDNALVRFDGATGKIVQNSGVILDDSNNLTGINNLTGSSITATTAFNGNLNGNATTATTATNFSGVLAGDVTGTQGATVVASVGGVTAANVASGANAANAATSANVINTIVKRDGSGNFSAGDLDVNALTAGNMITASSFLSTVGIYDSTVDVTLGNAGTTSVTIAGILNNNANDNIVGITNAGLVGVNTSSARFKNNIKNMGDTSVLYNLRPVTFTYKSEPNKIRYGLIAEEVEKVLPYLVSYDKEGKPFSVQYHLLSAVLLNELIKLKKEVDELKAKINTN